MNPYELPNSESTAQIVRYMDRSGSFAKWFAAVGGFTAIVLTCRTSKSSLPTPLPVGYDSYGMSAVWEYIVILIGLLLFPMIASLLSGLSGTFLHWAVYHREYILDDRDS